MNCENPFCAEVLSADHITMISTKHVRRFCSVECLIESYYRHLDALHGVVDAARKPV